MHVLFLIGIFYLCRGVGNSCIMEFSIEAFRLSPTLQALEKCRKSDLFLIADFYDIPIPRVGTKQVIREALCDRLVRIGVFEFDESSPELRNAEAGVQQDAEATGGESVGGNVVANSLVGLNTEDLKLAVKLKELDLEVKRQEHNTQLLKMKQYDLESQGARRLPVSTFKVPLSPALSANVDSHASPINSNEFDISRQIRLVPTFRETEVDSYFNAFERIAAALRWPREIWPLLLQCKLVGKAQEVCAAMSIEDSLDYDALKASVLRAYELVPEAYRQKFRCHLKGVNQTFVEFARDKGSLFDKWCQSSKVSDFGKLRELLLLEDFKNSLSDRIVVHLNDQKVTTLSEAAVCADEFVLTHKNNFLPPNHRENFQNSVGKNVKFAKTVVPNQGENRECFYCHEFGHLIAVCPVLKRKNQSPRRDNPKSVGFVRVQSKINLDERNVDSGYDPFICDGVVSFVDKNETKSIRILRDTGAAQSFILDSVLPFSKDSSCNSTVLVQGIELGILEVPLHYVNIKSDLVSGPVKIAVRPQLPIRGIELILGNDLAGEKVLPLPEVINDPIYELQNSKDLASEFPSVFPACAVTRAQARKFGVVAGLSDSFLNLTEPVEESLNTSDVQGLKCTKSLSTHLSAEVDLSLFIDRASLITEQRQDVSLSRCRMLAVEKDDLDKRPIAYFWDDGLLMRKWSSVACEGECNSVYQIVVPMNSRSHVLTLAHDHNFSGHLGITKTYKRILRHFFWPGLKSDVVKYCRSCHVCQLVGKPNQTIPPAPLCPIPVVGEPFEHLILDCVGPLPKTKTGHKYLLTLMCTATRFPEAIPLRSLSTKVVLRSLIKFFSTFGLPKIVQTDQGSNFMSRVFKQVLTQLNIKHHVASAYHPESQGALERFHQTLKSMLRTYCADSAKEWDEGLPLLLFAIRETTQESLGFSPADLVFGHTVRGPLKLLKEKWMSRESTSTNVLDYVSSFRERLHKVCDLARISLSSTQAKMKSHFDQKAVFRSFNKGDKVLVLLPILGSALQARFHGPYVVESKLSETDYVICTPDRKRKTRVCHINMLKLYVTRDDDKESNNPLVPVASVSVSRTYCPDEDGLTLRDIPVTCVRLQNSQILADLESFLSYLPDSSRSDVSELIQSHHALFSDVPSRTTAAFHDIEVGDHNPIKQHAYRLNPTKRELMQSEIKYLLDNGLAVSSYSPWSSPCLLVPKSDGSVRFCTDYRRVNAVTKADSFPLPRMEDCVDKVGSAMFVTKLDLLKGYWQIPLTPRAAEISAFVTPDNLLQYTVMAFGLRNAPATFQRLMNSVLAGVSNCEAYLDDVVIYSSTWDDHLKSLHDVFNRFQEASLTVNLAKCEFGKATVTYLGKQVGQGQVCPVSAKVQAILEFPMPGTKKELRRFLGMVGYYRGFCRNFSDIVLPLTNLLSQSRDFVWSDLCQTAFDSVKSLLCSTPVLKAPNFSVPFKIEVDASASGAGAVLLQEDDHGMDHPVCYFSKKFLKHQLHYSTIEKEALALLLSLQHFEVYVGSSSLPVKVFTDHNPLTFLAKMQNSNQRIMRWALIVQEFNIDICYKKGKENVLADALSRSVQE